MKAERAVPPERRRAFRLQLSYLEIYREEARDLLLPSASASATGPGLSIREDGAGIAVAGLSLHEAASLEAVADLLYRGALARATATTNMNAHSSRSHAVCTLRLESWLEAEAGNAATRRTLSKFNLVDLAGSERAKRTGAEGDRLKEGIQINKGLLALGNVISALTDPGRKGTGHVPYRDSKITRLLQDSLGGSAFTVRTMDAWHAVSVYSRSHLTDSFFVFAKYTPPPTVHDRLRLPRG
jgi:kinesin family protein 4/21/27